MRILSGAAATARVHKLAARGSQYAQVEPAVRRIIADVRKHGDRALRKYAERWDGLSRQEPLRVSEEEINAAWKSTSAELRNSLRACGGEYSPILRMAKANGLDADAAGNQRRPNRTAVGFSRLLRSGRTLPTGVDITDDGDSRAGRWCTEYPRRIS